MYRARSKVDLELEVIEELPQREEFAMVLVPRITVIGAIVQNNIAVTVGTGNIVNQVNSLAIWLRWA